MGNHDFPGWKHWHTRMWSTPTWLLNQDTLSKTKLKGSLSSCRLVHRVACRDLSLLGMKTCVSLTNVPSRIFRSMGGCMPMQTFSITAIRMKLAKIDKHGSYHGPEVSWCIPRIATSSHCYFVLTVSIIFHFIRHHDIRNLCFTLIECLQISSSNQPWSLFARNEVRIIWRQGFLFLRKVPSSQDRKALSIAIEDLMNVTLIFSNAESNRCEFERWWKIPLDCL